MPYLCASQYQGGGEHVCHLVAAGETAQAVEGGSPENGSHDHLNTSPPQHKDNHVGFYTCTQICACPRTTT